METEEEEVIVGIKELVDVGLREVPPIYVRPPDNHPTGSTIYLTNYYKFETKKMEKYKSNVQVMR